jgi:hypothetical protein
MQFRNFIKLALASAVGVQHYVPRLPSRKKLDQKSAYRAQGFSQKTAKATAFKTTSPTQADF